MDTIDINKLSFIVLISFGYGYGVDKSMTTNCMKDLKKKKVFLDKPGKRDVETLMGQHNESGCTQHKFITRISLEGLKNLLFEWINPTEVTMTMGSMSLEYGHCAAVSFQMLGDTGYSVNENSLYCTLSKAKNRYQADCIEAMAGFENHMVYVTPVYQKDDGTYELCEVVYDKFVSFQKDRQSDIEDQFNYFFDRHYA